MAPGFLHVTHHHQTLGQARAHQALDLDTVHGEVVRESGGVDRDVDVAPQPGK
jgi:hypothetical protein